MPGGRGFLCRSPPANWNPFIMSLRHDRRRACFCSILGLLAVARWAAVAARPPGAPVRCGGAAGCLVSNAYGAWGDRGQCRASAVAYPTTEEEVRAAVALAARNKLKVKVVSGFSHTIPKLACPAAKGASLVISTAKLNNYIEVNAARRVVTADAGVGLRQLIDAVEASGMSLVAAPYWEGVSVGGVISTGSHGSSWWGKGGAVHDHLVGLRLVVPGAGAQGYANIIELDGGDETFNAAKVSMGLLGVITRVTLSLEPAFKRSIRLSFRDDGGIEDDFMELAGKHEFADISWYPSQRTAVYRLDDRVPLNSSGDGKNDFLGFQALPIVTSVAVRALERANEAARSVTGVCAMAAIELASKKTAANGLKNDGRLFLGYPVVGQQGRMQTSGSCAHSSAADFLNACAWDPSFRGLFFFETTAIFAASRFGAFVTDVKKLRDLRSDDFCGVDVYNGFLVRFIKASAAYLGQPEDSVAVDFNYFRADDPSTPRLNQDVWEEVEQMAFFKHGARPHWGKNRRLAFLGVHRKYPNFGDFTAIKTKLDPAEMFSSEWSDDILFGGAVGELRRENGCAMEGLCVCSEDRHCNPSRGYLCKPGLVYKEARVCGFVNRVKETLMH